MLPPGEWSPLIVGEQWVDDPDLMVLSLSISKREDVKNEYLSLADMLRRAQIDALAEQQGYTVDDLRRAFRQGEEQARRVATNNEVKATAYGSAYNSIVSLRQDLTALAAEGNQRIKEIQNSAGPAAVKAPQIVAAIQQYQALARITAAKYSANIFDATQRIFDAEGAGQSARQFAQAHGLDVGRIFRPTEGENLEEQVKGVLNRNGSPSGMTPGLNTPVPPVQQPSGESHPASSFAPTGFNAPAPLTQGSVAPITSTSPARITPGLNKVPSPTSTLGGPQGLATTPPAATATPTPSPPIRGGTSVPGTPMMHAPSSSLPTGSAAPPTGAPTAPASPVQPVTPADLMHSFDKGMQAGTPISATSSPIPPPHATDPQGISTTPTGGTGNVPVNAPAYEAPPVAHAAPPDATPAPQVVAGPSTPAAPPTPPAPAGPLPAYASDIRPTVSAASAPVAPPTPPSSSMASSAPVHPSAGQGTPAGPTVVRSTPPPAPPASPSSLGTQAVAATATGAVAGAASANATAQARLQRLVFAVARQQPRLAWAAGDRPDETTVLTTDLASGWIPPGIELPAAVTLLPPERRRGDIETLLGEVTMAAGYTPIHHVPEEDEPVRTSTRPRQVPDIDELGWELNQATQWRDGLPRLAHTLAKAATSGTGVLDKEVDLLRTHLREVSTSVLDSYPTHVDLHEVGNWQLLAAIDALIAGDKTSASYHLAWFQACSATTHKVN